MEIDQKKRTLTTGCLDKIGQTVRLYGWVQTVRAHGKIAFLDLRDRSGIIQIVGADEIMVPVVSALGPQDVVGIVGVIREREQRYINKDIPTGTIEVEAKKIETIQKSREMPFDMGGKNLNLELPTLLDYRSLTLRHPTVSPIFKVQAAIVDGFAEIAKKLGCVEIFVPTIAASATEGGAEVFKIDYYDHKAFLTQSPQLYKQMLVPVFERVFTIAHAYRAEPSVTTRHLSESTQMDCEFGFVDFHELLDLLEQAGTYTLKKAQEQCGRELREFEVAKIAFGKIPRLTLREAQEVIYKETGRDSRQEKDLTPQDEADICKWALTKHKSDFVTITHFPTNTKPFYTMPDPKEPQYSLSYDLLFRGVEILSGSQRIHHYEQLVKSIQSRGLNPKSFALYLQAFQYGMPPEGGFSFGLERMTMKLLGLGNIRQASLFPRDMERVDIRLAHEEQETKDTKQSRS